MSYRTARNGQVFGPYSDAEVRRYIASGNILLTDLVQPLGATEWVSVLQQFPASVTQVFSQPPTAPVSRYPAPPDLPWWLALALAAITGGVFIVVWDIVQAAWVRKVQPASNALALYIALAVVYALRLPSSWASINYNIFGGPPVGPHHGFLLFLLWLGLFLASRSAIRQDLLRHFNGVEHIGLRLNAFFVYIFGGIYIQYHFNRINEAKRAMHVGVAG